MRSFAIAIVAALLVASASLAARSAEAKCQGPMLDIQSGDHEEEYTAHLEAEWGDTVRLQGYCWAAWSAGELVWTAEEVEVFARFLPERPDVENSEPPLEPSLAITDLYNAAFEELLRFDDIYGAPEQPRPGWIELIARSGGEEARSSFVVTLDGRRPPGSAYVSGRVHSMPPPPYGIYVVWAPVDDPGPYRFTIVPSDGEYRTDYLYGGDWFIGIYDINEELQAAGPELQPVTGYSRELDKNVTLTGLTLAVPNGQSLQGIDFVLADVPGPASEATQADTAPDETQASPPAPVEARDAGLATQLEESGGGSAGWLGPALLGTGGGLILAMAAVMRWRRRLR